MPIIIIGISGSSKSSASSSASYLSGSSSSCNKPSVVNVFWESTYGIYSGGATLDGLGNYVSSSGSFINIDWNAALSRWEIWDGAFYFAIKNGDPCDPTGNYGITNIDYISATVTT